MGKCFSYLNPANDLSEISEGRWKVMGRLLEVLLDYVNAAMHEQWAVERFRNVVLRETTTTPPSAHGRHDAAPPAGAFTLGGILHDLSDEMDEIIFVDAVELRRLLTWAEFLEYHDGAFEFFAPLVNTLREKTARIEQYVTGS